MALLSGGPVEIRIRNLCYTARFKSMLQHARRTPTTFATLALGWLLLLSGCGGFSEKTLVATSPEGAVYLQRLPTRGATVRFSGPLKSFKASHPITLAPEVLAKALAGIQIELLPADHLPNEPGIRPTPLFSAHEIAYLAPAIAIALQQAEPEHRVKFQVGSETQRTDGTLYVDGPVMILALSHYRSLAERRDENLPIYALAFTPTQAQLPVSRPQTWMEIEADQPRVAIAYGALAHVPAPGDTAPSANSPSAPGQTTSSPARTNGGEMEAMKEVVDKQAAELQSLKTELEALKQQLHEQAQPSSPKPARKPSSP